MLTYKKGATQVRCLRSHAYAMGLYTFVSARALTSHPTDQGRWRGDFLPSRWQQALLEQRQVLLLPTCRIPLQLCDKADARPATRHLVLEAGQVTGTRQGKSNDVQYMCAVEGLCRLPLQAGWARQVAIASGGCSSLAGQ